MHTVLFLTFVSVCLCTNVFLYQFDTTKFSLHVWELLGVNKIFLKNYFLKIVFAGRYATSKGQEGHKGPSGELRR